MALGFLVTGTFGTASGNVQDQHPVYVYYVGVSLTQGKAVQKVVLPDISAIPPAQWHDRHARLRHQHRLMCPDSGAGKRLPGLRRTG